MEIINRMQFKQYSGRKLLIVGLRILLTLKLLILLLHYGLII
uniref:Uncharacterized protein n=1 Tax=virus sp. ctrcb4 TaxID=2825824 RepID=A0A8S5RPR1_9VIRU|nr:MAG TPA: hypothetical protein [virus sp. ctrcb4]